MGQHQPLGMLGRPLSSASSICSHTAQVRSLRCFGFPSFAIAVFGGTLGSVLLLAKKLFALPVFTVSLMAILIQQYYNFIVINSVEIMGSSAVFMPLLVVIIGILLLYVSFRGKQQGWLYAN